MRHPRRSSRFGVALRRALAIGGALALGGCVSLLPKASPVQLYRFGWSSPSPPGGAAALVGRGEATIGVILSEVTLPRAALNDSILTVTGDKAAYVAGARWLQPAVLMFRDAAQEAFEARSGRVRLVDRGQLGAASALLRLDVAEFDLRYDPAGAAAPTVAVRLRATLTRADGAKLLERSFEAERPVADNRMGPIVEGFNAAAAGVLAEVVDWTDTEAPALVAGLAADAPTQALPPHAVRLTGPR